MDARKFRRYAELKILERDTAVKLADLLPTLKKEMTKAKKAEYTMALGVFMIRPMPVYEYSDRVTEAEIELELLKGEEKQTGVAKAKNRKDLIFLEKKI